MAARRVGFAVTAVSLCLALALCLAARPLNAAKATGGRTDKIYTPKDRKCGICESIADALVEKGRAAVRRGDDSVHLEDARPAPAAAESFWGRLWAVPSLLASSGVEEKKPPARRFPVSTVEHARKVVAGICDEVVSSQEGGAAKSVSDLFARSSQAGVGSFLDEEKRKQLMADLLKKSGRLREPSFAKEQCEEVRNEVKWGLIQVAMDGGRFFYNKLSDDFETDAQLQRVLREAKTKNKTKSIEESIVDSKKDEKSSLSDDTVDYSTLRQALGSFEHAHRDACLPVCDIKLSLRIAVLEYSRGIRNLTAVTPQNELWDFLLDNALLFTVSSTAIVALAAVVQWKIIGRYQRDTKAASNRAAARRVLLAKQQEAARARLRETLSPGEQAHDASPKPVNQKA